MRQRTPSLFKRSHVSHMNVLRGKSKIYQQNLRHIWVYLASRKHLFHHVMVPEDVNLVDSVVRVNVCMCLLVCVCVRVFLAAVIRQPSDPWELLSSTRLAAALQEKRGVRWVSSLFGEGKVVSCWLLSQTYVCKEGKWMGVGQLQRPTLLSYKGHS